jgi:CheY-like chemotaxis protein
LKVLIVDDDRPMRELIKRILGDLVDEFCECTGGRDAPAFYATGHPDWVLMDIRMKDGDGLTATEEIVATHSDARVIILTSFNDASLREAARKVGAKAYVLKENLAEIRGWLKPDPGHGNP